MGKKPHRHAGRRRQEKERARSAQRKSVTRAQRAAQQAPSAPLPPDAGSLAAPAGDIDMSSILSELASPLLDAADELDEARLAILLGATAWNMSMLPPADAAEIFQDVAQHICSGSEAGLKALSQTILGLIARKKHLFPGVGEFVTNAKVIDAGGRYEVLVTHVPFEPYQD
jgi:hypothetical protein